MASPMPRFPPVTSTDLATNTSPHGSELRRRGRCRTNGIARSRPYREPGGPGRFAASPGMVRSTASAGATAWFAAPAGSGVLEAEADLEAHLVMVDRVVDDVAADLGHLEPVQMPQRLAGAGDRVRDRLVDAFPGRADYLGHAVGAICHRSSPSPGYAIASDGAYRWVLVRRIDAATP